jgi:hypothetical protein
MNPHCTKQWCKEKPQHTHTPSSHDTYRVEEVKNVQNRLLLEG